MKKQATSLYILRLSLTLLAITAVVAALLAGVNAITKDKIAALNAQKTLDAIAKVLPDGDFAEAIGLTGDSGIVHSVYASETGYAIQVSPAGFGGDIDLMVGIGKDGAVLGIAVISHTETAGLGAVAAAENSKGQAFRDQFQGLSGILAVTKDGGTIDAISGATVTSRAVTEGVNAALAWVAENG